jgi:hypothetical protein
MRITILFFTLSLLLAACHTKKTVNDVVVNRSGRYLPEVCGDLVFNLPVEEVLKKRPKLAPVNYVNDAFNFRKEFVETIDSNGIEKIIYFFDADDTKVFYEAIVVYESEKKRDEDATRLLGPPNTEGDTEWELDSRQNFKVRAWKFEKKLIVAAILPGTEWAE